MHVGREALADLVRARMDELHLKAPEVARRSGGLVSHGTVWNILNLRVTDIKEESLRGLARGLGLPPETVFDCYYGAAEVGDAEQKRRELLLRMFDDIPEECQLDVLASLSGIHQRRSISAKIYERHEARAQALEELKQKVEEQPPDSGAPAPDAPMPGELRRKPKTKRTISGENKDDDKLRRAG
jgi:transcriptional regulator with XRE-family HTH domain